MTTCWASAALLRNFGLLGHIDEDEEPSSSHPSTGYFSPDLGMLLQRWRAVHSTRFWWLVSPISHSGVPLSLLFSRDRLRHDPTNGPRRGGGFTGCKRGSFGGCLPKSHCAGMLAQMTPPPRGNLDSTQPWPGRTMPSSEFKEPRLSDGGEPCSTRCFATGWH